MALNFEKDIEIDETALDVEILRQPTLFYKYTRYEANKKKALALAHERVKTIRSELVKEASTDKSIKNATQIEAYYRNDPDYQEAKEVMIEAEYEANMASNAVWAFNQRKIMLENLVKLALADYFARPTDPRDLTEEVNKIKEREKQTKNSRTRSKHKLSRKRSN